MKEKEKLVTLYYKVSICSMIVTSITAIIMVILAIL